MIVGRYTLDLYCVNSATSQDDGRHRCARSPYPSFPAQFTGQTERECKSAARKAGWKFVAGDVICRQCQKRALDDRTR